MRRLSDCDLRWVLYNVPPVPELENLTSEALLARFASDSAENSFAELVRRHLPMVYRTALRLTRGDAHLAEDVSQIVFADLWRKARTLSSGTIIAGWLYRHTWFTAGKLVRGENRRAVREKEAQTMHSEEYEPAPSEAEMSELRASIDAALNTLSETDRNALVMRFFEGAGLRQLGEVLGVSEDAAQKRVTRALEKVRHVLSAQGSMATLGAIVSGLSAFTIDGAVPASLAGKVLATSVGTASATGFMTKLIYSGQLKAVVALIGVVLVGVPLLQQNSIRELRREREHLRGQLVEMDELRRDNERLRTAALSGAELARMKADRAELQRLRGEVTLLREQARKAIALAPVAQPETSEIAIEKLQVTVEVQVAELNHELIQELQRQGLPIANPGDFTLNVNEPLARKVTRFFRETEGVDLLSMPKLTTLNQREAVIEATEDHIVGDQKIPVGTKVDVIPEITPDKSSINLDIKPEAHLLIATEGGPPAFRSWSGDLHMIVASGNTVVLGRTPQMSRQVPGAENKLLVFCITPTIIDAAGNRFQASKAP
jgi:RNA polymerase sigma factor (sigma-70 family)